MPDGERPNARGPRLPPGTVAAVTGATGFIGGRLVERLVGDGITVIAPIRDGAVPKALPAGSTVRVLPLDDPEAVRAALRGVHVVFHCAFDWSDESWNYGALRSLIAGAAMHRCRLVHLSSYVVYDIPQAAPLTEDSPDTGARSGYARVKLELERDLLRFAARGEVDATIIQPVNVYGPFSKPWTIDPADMLEHGTVVLPEADLGIANLVYVDDLVDALLLAATRPEARGQRFLVSGPSRVTWGEFYAGIAAAIGAKGPEFRPAWSIEREATRSRKMLRLAREPERIVRRIAHIGPARKLVAAATRRFPGSTGERIRHRLYGPENTRRGQVHLPDPGRLGFLNSRAVITSAKAREELGYAPRFDFAAGLAATSGFLRDRLRA